VAIGGTILVTWPLVRCLGVCLGRPPDTLVSLYFLHWVAHALTTPGVRVLDAPMFAPYRDTLALGEYLPAYVPLALPVLRLSGNPVVAHNVVLMALYVLTAVGTTALAARLLGSAGPALVAGLAFAFSPRLLDQAYNLQTMSIAWVPWLFLAFEGFLDRPTWARATGMGVLTLGLALSSLNMLVFAGIVLAVLVVADTLGCRRLRWPHAIRLVSVATLTAGVLAAYVAPYARAARAWGLGRTLIEVERGSASVAGYVSWPREMFLMRLLHVDGATSSESLLLGLTVSGLAVAGLLAFWHQENVRVRLLPYVAVAGVAFVLALGPILSTPWGAIPLPYLLLYRSIPGFDAIRTPARLVLFGDLAVVLVAGAGLTALLAGWRGLRRTLALGAVALAVLAESILIPFPGVVQRLDPNTLPEVYRWLKAQPPETVALGIPMGDWVNVAAVAFHLRRTVNGWASYDPPRYADLVAAMSTFPDSRTLALVHGVHPDLVLVDRQWMTPARALALSRPDSGLLLERVFPTHVVYRVTGPMPAGPEVLEASVSVETLGPPGLTRACLVLRNPGSSFVPLYPVRRLSFEARSEAGMPLIDAERWLPLDLTPGAEYRECMSVDGRERLLQVRGRIDGAGRALGFRLTLGDAPRPLTAIAETPR
jgi:hypothetical protein